MPTFFKQNTEIIRSLEKINLAIILHIIIEQEILAKKRAESKNQELERIIKKLKEDEQVLISLQNKFDDVRVELKGQIAALEKERDGIQGELDNLRTQLNQTQNERGNLQNQVNELTTQRGNLNQQLDNANALITNIQNLLGINDLNNLPLLPEGETLTSLLGRPTQEQLQEKENKINEWKDKFHQQKNRVNNLQTELNMEEGWWDKWIGGETEIMGVGELGKGAFLRACDGSAGGGLFPTMVFRTPTGKEELLPCKMTLSGCSDTSCLLVRVNYNKQRFESIAAQLIGRPTDYLVQKLAVQGLKMFIKSVCEYYKRRM